MNALYDTLNLLETIPLIIFMLCYPFAKMKRWIFKVSFFAVVALLLFNIIQLILEISLEKSVFFSVFLIVIWTLWLIVSWRDFRHGIKK